MVSVPNSPRKITLLANYFMQTVVPQNRQKKSLYPLIKKYAKKTTVDGSDLWITCPEHALLEAFLMRGQDMDDNSALIRWLRKNASTLREDIFGVLISERYISSANRLKYLAIDHDLPLLHRMMLDCIDRYGKGCHLSREFLSNQFS